jgi:RNA polymerase sigma factor (sigma-70 family)
MNRARYWRAGQRDAGEQPAASEVAVPSGMQATPSAEAQLVEELALFESAFERLSDDQRALIASFYVERRSHAEIAAERGISEAYSRTLLSRAISRLARFGSPAL